jgi:hypothetical protein
LAITNGYCTLAEIKASLRIPSADTVDDSLLETAVESASRLVDGFAGRNFYPNGTATRFFTPEDTIVCEIDDLISLSSLVVSADLDGVFDQTWNSTDYQLEPLNGRADGLTGWPATRIRAVGDYVFGTNIGEASVRVIGTWGWSAVPSAIKQATVIQSSRIFKRLDSPLGVLSAPDLGYIRVGTRLDPDVQQLVEPYRLARFLA